MRRPAYFSNITIDQSYNVVIEDKKILNIEHEDHSYLIYSELVTDSLLTYKNYIVNNNAEIKIGNSNNAEIRYCNPNISPCEAILRRKNGILEIIDDNSKFGVFVNNEKVREATLKLGDVISILGLKIIIGNNSIAVNSISDLVFINETFLSKMNIEYASKSYYDDELYDTQDKYYNRPPRRNVNREEVVISIDGPPMSMNQKSMPLMLRMGSSMVMGGMAAFAGNFTTLLSSVLFPFISSKYTDKQRQEYESLRVTKYNEYLNAKKDEIDKACEEEKIELNRKYPEIGFVMAATRKKRNMWERRPIDDDFLCVRLGEGSKLMSTRIEFPERRFDLEHDELEENMYQIAEKKYIINNIPAVLSLIDFFVIGFRGSKEAVLDYLLQMIVQITSYHSYDEVKTVFLINENDLDKFDCIKYLPHVWDDQNKMRFIATNEAEAYSIGEYIKNQFIDNKDEKSDLKKILKKRPYYLIFAFDKKVFDCHETFKEIMQNEYNQGATFIIAHNELPKETMVVLSLTDGFNGKYTPLTAN